MSKISIVKKCSNEMFLEAYNKTTNITDLLRYLGCKSRSQKYYQDVRQRMLDMNLSPKNNKRKSFQERFNTKDTYHKIDLSNYPVCKKNGRDVIYYPEHPHSHCDGTVYVHIIQAENKIGRFLTTGEVVHHVNLDRNDNSENNLWIFASNRDHSCYHSAIKNNLDYQLINVNGIFQCKLLVNIHICPKCGNNKSKKAHLCRHCQLEEFRQNHLMPMRDELKNKLWKMHGNFVQTSKLYKVTDNTVRKWCRKYGLPYTSKEWNQMTKQEFQQL